MTQKTKYLGKESGKSSAKWFGGPSAVMHPQGNGASAGDGRTSNPSLLGRIVVAFLPDKR